MLTNKQWEVVNTIREEDPIITICSGAKRAGKTYVLNLAFLAHVAKFKNQNLNFVIGGATGASIRRNVLSDLEKILQRNIELGKFNDTSIFGNTVYCLAGEKADSWKTARGFTAAGAFLNEGTALNDVFVKEVISRCSHPGARILIDTNPENPNHPIKKDYIDKSGQRLRSGKLNIKAFNFTLFDNTALSKEYIESIVSATPTGYFTDRDIFGRWVSPEGLVYADFFPEKHYISRADIDKLNFSKFYAGVDWGYEHYGAIAVIGETDTGKKVLVKEYAAQHQDIDYWVSVAKMVIENYGNINFYCDSARPEHVERFQKERIKAINAKKNVLAGVEQVAKGFKENSLLIAEDSKRIKEEIGQYAWNGNTGEPIKIFDDVLDAVRYAIYTEYALMGERVKIDNSFII